MVRRLIVGIAVGVLASFLATPVEAAEWCLNDPALVFSAPHAKQKISIYATEGVQGSQHAYALRKSHVDFHAKPGRGRGTMSMDVHTNIEGAHHDSFSTVLIVSSQPYGAGTIYGVVMGSSNHDLHVRFEFVYQETG